MSRVNVCATCEIEFASPPKNPQRVYKFCSVACSTQNPEKRRAHSETMSGRRSGEDRGCKHCGMNFYALPYQVAKGEGVYCSIACARAGRKGRSTGISPPNKGIPMSEEQRVKCSIAGRRRVGPLAGGWRGGRTGEMALLRGSWEYRQWRTSVFERDNYTCQNCGQVGGYLNADHIKPFAYFPELRLDLDNGRTLCVPCHRATDTYAGRVHRLYGPKVGSI